MSFQGSSLGQERQNRKILEQLEERKKQLRMQAHHGPGGTSTGNSTNANNNCSSSNSNAGSVTATPVTMSGLDMHPMTQAQRTALQHAHANSVGYFITQDSSFGNLILPVLPRYDVK